MDKIYRLFISHSWTYPNAYDRIIQFLKEHDLKYFNHSVPKNDPIHTDGTDEELAAAIDAKMRGTSCVLILAGVYASHSRWINVEIEIAQYYQKPIIAIEHWGALRSSRIVTDNATRVVKWQGKSIVETIKELA
jgi:hypothetical protein